MESADIARVLSELADLLELTGENQFKVRAYRRAAQVADVHPVPLSALHREGRLTELPGIGAGIAGKVGELLDTGEAGSRPRTSSIRCRSPN